MLLEESSLPYCRNSKAMASIEETKQALAMLESKAPPDLSTSARDLDKALQIITPWLAKPDLFNKVKEVAIASGRLHLTTLALMQHMAGINDPSISKELVSEDKSGSKGVKECQDDCENEKKTCGTLDTSISEPKEVEKNVGKVKGNSAANTFGQVSTSSGAADAPTIQKKESLKVAKDESSDSSEEKVKKTKKEKKQKKKEKKKLSKQKSSSSSSDSLDASAKRPREVKQEATKCAVPAMKQARLEAEVGKQKNVMAVVAKDNAPVDSDDKVKQLVDDREKS